MDQADIAELELSKAFELEIDGDKYDLVLEDFEILSEDIPGWQVANDKDLTVALDITLTQALSDEGLAREIVNRVQNIRKSSGFNVTDRIIIFIKDDETMSRVVNKHGDYIKAETLGDKIFLDETLTGEETALISEISTVLIVDKA
jgi:isoleucyl-tRNA synthetase